MVRTNKAQTSQETWSTPETVKKILVDSTSLIQHSTNTY